jgi:hypothetical protein
LTVALAGPVKMDNSNYSEEYSFANYREDVGITAKFTYKIVDDKWYIKGGIDHFYIDEIWQRVK